MITVGPFTIVWILCAHSIFTIGAGAFSGNFQLTNLVVDAPSVADPTSTASSFLSFDFADQDTPDSPLVHCCLEWAAGQQPPSIPARDTCSDGNVTVCVPQGDYSGYENMTISLAHTYEDDSVGEAPYNILTKFASLILDYQTTPNYGCEMDNASCELSEGAVLTAVVTEAIA